MPIFVVHRHDSKKLHYDLRLSMKGVLESWALPKIPPRTKGLRRLAIYTNPHALSYAKFEGTIPKGSYGAGAVKIWDKGTYSLVEKDRNKIVVKFKGKKLKGEYCLIKFPRSGPKNWLFFKK